MPAEPTNIKTLKLFFAKDPDHQSSKEHSKCRNEERVRNTIEQEHTSETDVKENLKIVTDKIMLNNTEDFLPDFGYNKDVPHLKMKKIRSEKGCSDQESEREKINFSCRAFRSNSKRSSFEIKLSSKERSNKLNINVLSSSNSSRSKSKEKKGFALTMNPISTTNFKFAIGNLPIKVSRDDDMLFSFRNQVVTNRSIKENDSNQIPEYITSRYGEISYLLTNLEDNVTQFFNDFKMWVDNLDNDTEEDTTSNIDRSVEKYIKGVSSEEENDDEEQNSLITLLDIEDNFNDPDNQFDAEIDEHQFNERKTHEQSGIILYQSLYHNNFNSGKHNSSNPTSIVNKAKSTEPKQSMSANKIIESSLNLKPIDPLKISKSSTTPKSQNKKIKPQISILKSAKSTRATVYSSKKSTKSKTQPHISKTADRKMRKMLNNEDSKSGGRRDERISKKSMDRICNNPNDKSRGTWLITSPDNSNSGRGVIKFFSLKTRSSRNQKNKGKLTSVSTNRPYFKIKSNNLHTSKRSSSGRQDTSSKSQNNRNERQINFYWDPQSLRVKQDDCKFEENENTAPNQLLVQQKSIDKEEQTCN